MTEVTPPVELIVVANVCTCPRLFVTVSVGAAVYPEPAVRTVIPVIWPELFVLMFSGETVAVVPPVGAAVNPIAVWPVVTTVGNVGALDRFTVGTPLVSVVGRTIGACVLMEEVIVTSGAAV